MKKGSREAAAQKILRPFFSSLTYTLLIHGKDQALFNSYVTKQKGQLQFLKSNPKYFFQDTLYKIAYNNSPWVTFLPSSAEFENLKLDKIMADYNKIFSNADGCTSHLLATLISQRKIFIGEISWFVTGQT
jgi:zinc protease